MIFVPFFVFVNVISLPVCVAESIDKVDVSLPVHHTQIARIKCILTLSEQIVDDLLFACFFVVGIAGVLMFCGASYLSDKETALANFALNTKSTLVSHNVIVFVDANQVDGQDGEKPIE